MTFKVRKAEPASLFLKSGSVGDFLFAAFYLFLLLMTMHFITF